MSKLFPTKRRLAIVVTLCCLLIGGVLYQLADRYLIEHVEVVVAAEAAQIYYYQSSSLELGARS